MMFSPLIAWFGTLAGRLALGGGLVATFFGWLLIHDHRVRVEEKAAVIADVTQGAKALNEKGLKARAAVRSDGAAERLRKGYCSDC